MPVAVVTVMDDRSIRSASESTSRVTVTPPAPSDSRPPAEPYHTCMYVYASYTRNAAADRNGHGQRTTYGDDVGHAMQCKDERMLCMHACICIDSHLIIVAVTLI